MKGITKGMALFRGQPVAPVPETSPHSLVYLRKEMEKLLEADTLDQDRWYYFLGEAGCEELHEVAKRLSPSQRPQALVCLYGFASSEDWNIRDSVARVLGEMGDKAAEATLHVLSQDANDMVRRSALRGLATLGCELSQP